MVKFIAIRLLHEVLKVFYVFPINSKRYFFSSYNHEYYNCNPKYISEYFKNNYPEKYEIVWSFVNPEKYVDDHDIIKVKKYSLKWLYFIMTSKVIITNVTPHKFIPKRKNQVVINTWHAGGAYKKVGLAKNNLKLLGSIDLKLSAKISDYFVSSSLKFTETNIQSFNHQGPILEIGMPRNDIFFNEQMKTKADRKVREIYNLSEKDFVILYAPTYRESSAKGDEVKELHFDTLPNEIEGCKVVILCRLHHNDIRKTKESDRIIDVSDYDDMQELLCASNVLITDFSSSIWDYSLTGKPALLLLSAKEHERGYYMSLDEWPAKIFTDQNEMNAYLKSIDYDWHINRAKEHQKVLGSYECGNATQLLVDRIIEM